MRSPATGSRFGARPRVTPARRIASRTSASSTAVGQGCRPVFAKLQHSALATQENGARSASTSAYSAVSSALAGWSLKACGEATPEV